MSTPRKLGAARGRRPLDPIDDTDADLIADILARVPIERRPNWDGDGWSSHLWPAIRKELEIRLGVTIPAAPTEADTLPGKSGALVSARGRLNSLRTKIEGLEAAYLAHCRNEWSREGRIFAMGWLRRWLRHAEERVSANGASDASVVVIDVLFAHQQQLALAIHHLDVTGIARIHSYIKQAERYMKMLTESDSSQAP